MPPSNDKAEMALLGALMANNLAFARMSDLLQAHHFADRAHCKVFASIQRRVKAGQIADVITLVAEFEHSGALDEMCGSAYLQQLVTVENAIIDVHAYAEAIVDSWLRRKMIDLAEQVSVAAARARDYAFGGASRNHAPSGLETAEWLIARLQETTARLQSSVYSVTEVEL